MLLPSDTQLGRQSYYEAIALIDERIALHGIACDRVKGYLTVADSARKALALAAAMCITCRASAATVWPSPGWPGNWWRKQWRGRPGSSMCLPSCSTGVFRADRCCACPVWCWVRCTTGCGTSCEINHAITTPLNEPASPGWFVPTG